MSAKPYVWQMVREAIQALNGEASNVQVRDWVLQKYPGTNRNTIQCQTCVCTVNHASRIHYPENRNPRVADGPYDFLFRPERGRLEIYDPEKHGVWKITKQDDGRCIITQDDANEMENGIDTEGACFAEEAHLRDYLAQNLGLIEQGLQLYVDEEGTGGVEYVTPIGRIDILAVDSQERFLIIELKVGKGPDAVAGQVLRYKNWVKMNLAKGKPVRGIIIAQNVSEKILYAISSDPEIFAKQYELSFKISEAPSLASRSYF